MMNFRILPLKFSANSVKLARHTLFYTCLYEDKVTTFSLLAVIYSNCF